MFESALTMGRGVSTAPVFREDAWGAKKTIRTVALVSAEPEIINPDTDVSLTVPEMAEKFDAIGVPTSQLEVELSVDPDDYPLF